MNTTDTASRGTTILRCNKNSFEMSMERIKAERRKTKKNKGGTCEQRSPEK